MSNVVPIRRCTCGGAGTQRVVGLKGQPDSDIKFDACDACIAEAEAFLVRVRPVFNAMIDCGVPRDIANTVMGVLLSYVPDDTALENKP